MTEEIKVQEGATQQKGQTSEPLTMDAVQKLIQSETDKVRTEWSKKYKAIEKEKDELVKAKMTEEEKAKFELEKMQKELADKETAIRQKELALKTVDILRQNELPLDFQEFILGQDEETTVKRASKLKDLWQSALKQAVEARFKESGREPHKGSVPHTKEITREQFNAMTYKERYELYQTDPDLYNKLK